MSSSHTTIGIDLGDRKHAACVLSAAGDIVTETDIINTRECLTAFAQRHPGATFVMETARIRPVRTETVQVADVDVAGNRHLPID